MSDERLRDLERKWKETGSVEDGASFLRERLRIGDLSQELLELAAYSDHGPAVRVLGPQLWRLVATEARAVTESFTVDNKVSGYRFSDTELWILGLARWGVVPAGHAAHAVATLVVRVWTQARPDDPRPAVALATLADWLSDPSVDIRKSASKAQLDAFTAGYEIRDAKELAHAREAARAVGNAARIAVWAQVDVRKSHSAAAQTASWALDAGLDEASVRLAATSAVASYALSQSGTQPRSKT